MQIALPAYLLLECNSFLDLLSDASVYSAMDINSAFNNIPVAPELQK